MVPLLLAAAMALVLFRDDVLAYLLATRSVSSCGELGWAWLGGFGSRSPSRSLSRSLSPPRAPALRGAAECVSGVGVAEHDGAGVELGALCAAGLGGGAGVFLCAVEGALVGVAAACASGVDAAGFALADACAAAASEGLCLLAGRWAGGASAAC